MKKFALAAAVATAIAAPASASVVVLDFEGVGNYNPVGNYYAPDYIFSDTTLALVDADDGGDGNFANEPSSNTIMFFLDSNDSILDVTNGFTTGFSFFYSSSTAASVTVYDGAGGTGNVLATLQLDAQGFDNCSGDPTGAFCNWTAVGVNFAGTAYSIDFGGTANQTGFDDITFGSATPGGVPEPATWAMLITGFGLVGFAARRRRVSHVAA
ncbi:PEPxxWA-CTERM sorting domain-containing protein [Sandaracinobacteroides sp. A072]|uniref:PEPxxWA-CTERM sorting domain-containing protein n=1 Tax=Sandaracinobacteroides sp. A072 TaxID=3461146 RepID=UPI0040438295